MGFNPFRTALKPISYLHVRFYLVIFGLVVVIFGESWTRRGGLRPAVGTRVVNRAQEWLVQRDASRVHDGPLRRWDDDQRASGHAADSEVSRVKGDGAPRLADGPPQ